VDLRLRRFFVARARIVAVPSRSGVPDRNGCAGFSCLRYQRAVEGRETVSALRGAEVKRVREIEPLGKERDRPLDRRSVLELDALQASGHFEHPYELLLGELVESARGRKLFIPDLLPGTRAGDRPKGARLRSTPIGSTRHQIRLRYLAGAGVLHCTFNCVGRQERGNTPPWSPCSARDVACACPTDFRR